MSALITIILIVWGGYYLAKWFFSYGMPRLLMWLMHRQARKQYEQMFGQQPQQDSQQQQRSGQRRSPFSRQQRQNPPRRRHGKIITKDMGEYVEFEEISTYNSSQDQHEAPRKKYPEEPQISDADWEDL